MEYVDEDGVIHEDTAGTRAENASKASFKLDLIETVNADPMMEPSDLKLIAAYAALMQWPKREAWLSTSRARAMTGLSERAVTDSRRRLSGKNEMNRVYLKPVRKSGLTQVFRIENPWREDCRQHVAIRTEHFRESQAERQAERRRLKRVSAAVADTDHALSQSLGECDVPATSAGNIPADTPQDMAPKKDNTVLDLNVQSYGQVPDLDPDEPFPIPETDEELASAIADFVMIGCSPVVVTYFKQELLAGRLTMNMVEEQRRLRAA
ncbi:hypothetical protein [Aliihoeflea sp. 40Bstr573]|uniref:hypothetical protein n=1 Tax=Aliihoeflea sp. 40Bstr573 TaxID=2696467 RepID=UPI002095D780|nr:hypothetical protein [Aliihoeflea sp. 40Bstr573]MCO6386219.1 hypothetical protein [Aliihoeflea sp. 40Bstr573]